MSTATKVSNGGALGWPGLPPNKYPDPIYSNLNYVLDSSVIDKLAHDQTLYADHVARSYSGMVYCCVDENGRLYWYEQIQRFWISTALYRSDDLILMLAMVIEEMGNA